MQARSRRLVLFAALSTLPAPLASQRVSFGPEIGFYIPTEKLSELATGGEFTEIEGGPSFGARLGLWFGSRLGVAASGAYIPTTFKLSTASNAVTEEDAKLFIGSGEVVFFLLPPTGFLTAFLNGGVGVVSRGGVAFTDAAEKTDVGGVFGAGVGIRLGGIAVTAGAELFAYSAGYGGASQTSESLSQRDIHLKLGFGIPFGGGVSDIRP